MIPRSFTTCLLCLLVLLLPSGCQQGRQGSPDGPFAGIGVPVTPKPATPPVVKVATPPVSGKPATPAPPTAPAAPATASAGEPIPVFQAGDVLVLEVFQEAPLSGEFTVSADGSIRHPVLGLVNVRGMTASLAEVHLERMLKDGILVNPRVTVSLKSSNVRKVVINGQIAKPGIYEFTADQRLTLTGLIAKAGGFTPIARTSAVRVVRSRNGVEEKISVDVSDVFSGRKPDLVLEPDDKVFVPESLF